MRKFYSRAYIIHLKAFQLPSYPNVNPASNILPNLKPNILCTIFHLLPGNEKAGEIVQGTEFMLRMQLVWIQSLALSEPLTTNPKIEHCQKQPSSTEWGVALNTTEAVPQTRQNRKLTAFHPFTFTAVESTYQCPAVPLLFVNAVKMRKMWAKSSLIF